MCVIIHRSPGIDLPFDKLQSACTVNADGMGIAVVDRGRIELRRIYNPKGNDPEKLATLLNDAKHHDIYIHLRYATRGATDLGNVHPFTVLKQKKHGVDIQFMHNGTLTDFGNQADCDSKDFAQTVLSPLLDKLRPGIGEENLLTDPTVYSILSKYAGRNSVFLLADNFGNHLIVNRENGYQADGWWASNEYSFNANHRTSYKTFPTHKEWVQTETKRAVSLASAAGAKRADGEIPFDDPVPFDMGSTVGTAKPPVLPQRSTFCDVAGLKSLSEVTQLAKVHIEDMVEDYPENAVLLIMDLIYELYQRDRSNHMEYAQ